jgi:hypothetical protein
MVRNKEMEGGSEQSQIFLNKQDYFEEIDMSALVPSIPKYKNRKDKMWRSSTHLQSVNNSRYSLPSLTPRGQMTGLD